MTCKSFQRASPRVTTNVQKSAASRKDPFRDESEAIRLANDSIYGLSGSLWTRDLKRGLRVARAIETGVLSVNSSRSVFLEAPFGGVKRSGLGRELGMAALEGYSELKSIYFETEEGM